MNVLNGLEIVQREEAILGRMSCIPLQPIGNLWHSCPKVGKPIELLFGVVNGVRPGTGILDGSTCPKGK